MDAYPMDEIVEIDEQRFVQISFDRVWPRYVVSWSVRQRTGDSDFPLANGTIEDLPPREGPMEDLWSRLRGEALQRAHDAVPGVSAQGQKQGFFSKIFRGQTQ